MFGAVVCVDQNWGIGKNNELLFNFKEDTRRFIGLTRNKTIIVGRKTMESFYKGQPLVGRKNIVVTFDNTLYSKFNDVCKYYGKAEVKDGRVVLDLNESKEYVRDEKRFGIGASIITVDDISIVDKVAEMVDSVDSTIVCGGAQIYKELLPKCDTVFVTKVYLEKEADAFFPNLDEDPEWDWATRDGKTISEIDNIPYEFIRYARKDSKYYHNKRGNYGIFF